MYIVKQKVHGKDYYYLRKSVREGDRVISKSIAYLGKTRKEAEKKMKEVVKKIEKGEDFKNKEKANEKMNENVVEKIKGKNGDEKEINKLDEINRIASNKGFFFQTGNIYGGKAGFYTYGHLGKALRTNWENFWRKSIIGLDDNFYEIQSNNILPEEVFKASGHIENFNDPMAECKKCHFRFRADQFLEDNGVKDSEALSIDEMNKLIIEKDLKCHKCTGKLGEVKQFNMMFSVNVGFENEKSYLSPETAQGAYITFLEEFKVTRSKLPLGLAIIDKAYRNEISPRQMFFRLREFSQAELQIFFDSDKINEHEKWVDVKNEKLLIKFSGNDEIEEISCDKLNKNKKLPKWYLYHACKVQNFYLKVLEIPKEKFRFRELNEKERAFYNKIHFDVEIDLETLGGFKEVAGVHYRTDHDLVGHQKISGKNMEVSIDGKKILPHVLELSFGVDRNIWALLDIFCREGKEGIIFKFPSKLAPVKAAVFPIVKDPEFEKIAEGIVNDLNKEWNVVYDRGGSIGRRYARNDEIGTPYCITIDGDSIKNKNVTIRNRDDTKQIRVKILGLKDIFRKLINSEIKFEDAGELVETRIKEV